MTAALTLVGAIIVALITAFTTDRRLTRQLAAERERQELELTAEADRQAQSLAHDRALSDLAALRTLVDDIATALGDAERTVAPIRVAAEQVHPDKPSVLAAANFATLEHNERSLDPLILRCSVRLGDDDPLASVLLSAGDRLRNVRVTLKKLARSDEESGRLFQNVAAAVALFQKERKRFSAVAVAQAGLLVPDTGSRPRLPPTKRPEWPSVHE